MSDDAGFGGYNPYQGTTYDPNSFLDAVNAGVAGQTGIARDIGSNREIWNYTEGATPNFGVDGTSQAARALAIARQYDPNAQFQNARWVPEQRDSEGQVMSNGYWTGDYKWDNSLVPKVGAKYASPLGELANGLVPIGSGTEGNDEAGWKQAISSQKYVTDPNAVFYDPNYGWVTHAGNLPQKDGFDYIGTFGPMLVGGAAGMLSGPMSGLSQMAMQYGPGIARSLANGSKPLDILKNIGISAGASWLGNLAGDAVRGTTGTFDTGITNPFSSTGGNFTIDPGKIAGGIVTGAAKQIGSGLLYPNGATSKPTTNTSNTTGQTSAITYPTGGTNTMEGNSPGEFNFDAMPPGYENWTGDTGGGQVAVDPSFATGGDASTGGGGWMQGINGFFGGSNGIDPTLAQRIGAAGSAINAYNNSGKYMDMATKYADKVNPFDLSQRQMYQGALAESWADPTAFLQDEGFKKLQERNMAGINAKMAAQGYAGSGNQMTALADYLDTSNYQHLSDQRNQLAKLAGADISPASAADLIKTGITGSIQAQNDALANAAAFLAPKQNPSTVINNTNTGGNNTATNGGSPTNNGAGGMPRAATLLQNPKVQQYISQLPATIISALKGMSPENAWSYLVNMKDSPIYNSTTGEYNPGFVNENPFGPDNPNYSPVSDLVRDSNTNPSYGISLPNPGGNGTYMPDITTYPGGGGGGPAISIGDFTGGFDDSSIADDISSYFGF